MQRKIEAAGISTITLSGIPDLTASVGASRLAAIEYPLGYVLGQPGDKAGQLAVLSAVLKALGKMEEPGSVVHLPFEWPEAASEINANPEEEPPIVSYLLKHPWQLPNFFNRKIPKEFRT